MTTNFLFKIIKKKLFYYLGILCTIVVMFYYVTGLNKDYYRVVIFREKGFPTQGIPEALTPEWVYDILSKKYHVVYIDYKKLQDEEFFSIKDFDLLIMPYGETFPYKAYNNITRFLKQGGGFLNLAGIPFWQPVEKIDGKWEKVDVENRYQNFLAPLGIKYYQVKDQKFHLKFNSECFSDYPKMTLEDVTGITLTTSYAGKIKKPTRGNIFPERIPCRDYIPLATVYNKEEEVIAYPIVLLKSWRNPYSLYSQIPKKSVLVGVKGKEHPLNPNWNYSKEFLLGLVELLKNPLVLYDTHTELATYKENEKVKFYTKILNISSKKEKAQLKFEIFNESKEVVFNSVKDINIEPEQNLIIEDFWHPIKFKDDFYTLSVSLIKNGKVIDKDKNGFVVWDKDILFSGVRMDVRDNKIFLDNKPVFIYGTNYYESKLGELIWLRPNVLGIKKDFEKMCDMGINFVRIHYHHSKWFKDYLRSINSDKLNDEFFNVADDNYLPSERSLRILDAIIQLAQKYELILCLDIFSLIPEEMGNPLGWLEMEERILNKSKIENQKDFIEILAKRYKRIPGVTWDLWNEPRLKRDSIEELKLWARNIINIFYKYKDRHPVTMGGNISLRLLNILDYGSIHTYYPEEFKKLSRKYKKPVIFQEIWNTSDCSLEKEIEQAEKIRKDFSWIKESKTQGFVPWQWTRQSRLWGHMSSTEKWDDELGCIVHCDGTFKPAGEVYKRLIKKIK